MPKKMGGRAPNGFDQLLNPPTAADSAPAKIIEISERPFRVHEENGRYYHDFKRGTYPFPCDDPERNRQDLCHFFIYKCIFRHVDGEDCFAKPLVPQSPNLVIDFGCGSGAWCMDIAKRFPEAEIEGADLAGGQPDPFPNLRWRTPDGGPNQAFDFEDDHWDLSRNAYDLVHAGHLCGSISDWSAFLSKCFRIMRPDGRFESLEIDWQPRCDDGTLPPNSAVHKWWEYELHATANNKSLAYPDMRGLLHRAGFVDIEFTPYHLPFHAWMNKRQAIGFWMKSMLVNYQDYPHCHTFNGLSMAPFTRNLRWSREQVEAFAAQVMACVDTYAYHGYFLLYIVTARKPGHG